MRYDPRLPAHLALWNLVWRGCGMAAHGIMNLPPPGSESYRRKNPHLFCASCSQGNTADDESKLHEEIYAFLRQLGVRAIVHSRMDRATTNAKGTADFLFVFRNNAYAVEAKAKGGKLTPEQTGFLLAAQLDGWTSGLVRSVEDLRKLMGL